MYIKTFKRGPFIHDPASHNAQNHRLPKSYVVMLRQNSVLRECGTAFVVLLLLFIWEMIIYGNTTLFLFTPNFHTALGLLNQSLTSPFFYFYIPRHSRPSGIVDFYSYFTTLPLFLLSFAFSATRT